MSRRRRHASPGSHAETEVWPAYVDVLSAAFVFVLLAFAALLTRDVADEEDRDSSERARLDEEHKFAIASKKWRDDGQAAMNVAARQMADELTPVGLGADCTLADTGQLGTNPNLVSVFSEQLVDLDGSSRHPVTLVCTFSPVALGFGEGDEKPEPKVQAVVVPKLIELAMKVVDHNCENFGDVKTWCSAGFEVVGHTDCKPVTRRGVTNWELGAARASWVLRSMIDGVPWLSNLRQGFFRVEASGRADREPRAQPYRVWAIPGMLDQFVPAVLPCEQQAVAGDLAQNRRVELLVYLRTQVLAVKPQAPKRSEL